jgi:hypothetical protein
MQTYECHKFKLNQVIQVSADRQIQLEKTSSRRGCLTLTIVRWRQWGAWVFLSRWDSSWVFSEQQLTGTARRARTVSTPSQGRSPPAVAINKDKRKHFSMKKLHLMCRKTERKGESIRTGFSSKSFTFTSFSTGPKSIRKGLGIQINYLCKFLKHSRSCQFFSNIRLNIKELQWLLL